MFTLLQEGIFVKRWVRLQNFRQYLGHFRLGEQSTWTCVVVKHGLAFSSKRRQTVVTML